MSLLSAWQKLFLVKDWFVLVIENNLREAQELMLVIWTLNIAIFSHINTCFKRYYELLVYHPLVWCWCVYDFKIWQVLCVYHSVRLARCSIWSNNCYDTSWVPILLQVQPKILDCGHIINFFHHLARYLVCIWLQNITSVIRVPLFLTCKM